MQKASVIASRTDRELIMKNVNLVWFAGLVLCFVSSGSFAQEKHSFSHSAPPQSSKYVKDFSIDVDDVPGHKIRIVEIQRSYTQNNPEVMGTKVLESWLRGSTNYLGGTGPAVGYDTWIMEDGAKIFLEWTSLSSSEPTATGSRRGTSNASSRFVGGTGKFAGIQGILITTVEFDTDKEKGYSRPTMRGEYWFAK
jgi:hypothetical protein